MQTRRSPNICLGHVPQGQRPRGRAHRAHFDQYGFGLWAVEIRNLVSFARFIGLAVPSFAAHFTPCVEIAWRLCAEHWGNEYATEGPRLCSLRL